MSVGAATMSGGPEDGIAALADAGTAPAPQTIVSAVTHAAKWDATRAMSASLTGPQARWQPNFVIIRFVTSESQVPGIDTTRPHPARVYDYLIGGKNHFAADRAVADRGLEFFPQGRTGPRENRAFLGRAVRYLAAEAGIRQFLDVGTGLPATGSVHEIAQAVAPETKVVYVDNDPLVLAHARALLTSSPEGRTAYIHADLRDPMAILSDPSTRDVLDFSQPVALMLVAVLHFITDDDKPAEIVRTLLGELPPGSYLAASHVTAEHNRDQLEESLRNYQRSGVPFQARDSDEFARLAFDGLHLVPPGVTLVSEWRPESASPRPLPSEVIAYGGIGRKP